MSRTRLNFKITGKTVYKSSTRNSCGIDRFWKKCVHQTEVSIICFLSIRCYALIDFEIMWQVSLYGAHIELFESPAVFV